MKRTGRISEKNFLKAGLLFLMILLLLVPAEASAAARISQKNKTILKGQSFTLKVKGSSQKAKWSSSKRSVASVNSAGVVRGKKAGSAVITAQLGGKKYSCKVTVRQPAAIVTLNKLTISLKKGKSTKVKAKVSPGSAYNKSVSWTSSNSGIASVSAKGKVTAKEPGNVIITATAKDGSGVCASCVVTVEDDRKPLILSETALTLYQGQSQTLSVSGANAQVLWGSSNQAVATVGADGTVVAAGPGQTQIAAMTADGLQYAYCDITVLAAETNPSATALQFLNVLAGYSQVVTAQKAAGHFLGYSNSGALVKNTWSEVLNDMVQRGIGYTNCAHTICLALRDMNILGTNQSFWGDDGKIHYGAGVQETLEQHCRIFYVDKTADQLFLENGLLPGDIVIWSGIGHTNVYAGDKCWYDTGRTTNGSYMKIKELKAAGVPSQTLTEDKKNDHDFPKLNKQIYVFDSLGPQGINLGSVKVGWIIRLL